MVAEVIVADWLPVKGNMASLEESILELFKSLLAEENILSDKSIQNSKTESKTVSKSSLRSYINKILIQSPDTDSASEKIVEFIMDRENN